jgi:hypothetical protein
VTLTTCQRWSRRGSVLDRGRGVPPSSGGKDFRAVSGLTTRWPSGIQGPALIDRRAALPKPGGTVRYMPRDGGGGCFTLRLPLPPEPASTERNRLDERVIPPAKPASCGRRRPAILWAGGNFKEQGFEVAVAIGETCAEALADSAQLSLFSMSCCRGEWLRPLSPDSRGPSYPCADADGRARDGQRIGLELVPTII